MESASPTVGNEQPRQSRKRNRPPASCGHCRIRKLKCSRTQPCDSCLRTGDSSTCVYESPTFRQDDGGSLDRSSNDGLAARIDRLETLLLSVTSRAAQIPPPICTCTERSGRVTSGISDALRNADGANERVVVENEYGIDQMIGTLGAMKVDQIENKTIYLGGAHWVSIMSEIEEFKNYLADNHENLEHKALENRAWTKNTTTPSSLLRGIVAPATREELLSYIPARGIADTLVDRFFDFYGTTFRMRPSQAPFFDILLILQSYNTRANFQERGEYSDHWNVPTKSKLIWLGVLFAMLHLAELSYEEPITRSTNYQTDLYVRTGKYKNRVVQCLVASDYTNPVTYTIETLVLYIEAEWLTSEDATIETSMALGLAIRLAMHMGIHRDSRSHPGITPFQGEMRRRLWAVIQLADILYSFHLSLPTTIRQGDCDCSLPRNIANAAFSEDSLELPASSPLNVRTEVSYTIAKLRLLLAVDKNIDLTNSGRRLSQADLQHHERTLYEAYDLIPPYLRVGPPEEPSSDPVELQKQRIGLDRVYQLGHCILYRKFLRRSRTDTSTTRYRASCIDAAISLLNHQSAMFLDFDTIYPQNVKRRHMSTLTTQDFFVAGMAIALDLYYGFKAEPLKSELSDIAVWGFDRRPEMISVLETSIEFWRISKDESVEAAKAYGMFSFVLRKVKEYQWRLGYKINAEDSQVDGSTAQPEIPSTQIEPEEDIPEFDWELWNSINGDSDDFESLFQQPSTIDTN